MGEGRREDGEEVKRLPTDFSVLAGVVFNNTSLQGGVGGEINQKNRERLYASASDRDI
jgi:hypothetical protein